MHGLAQATSHFWASISSSAKAEKSACPSRGCEDKIMHEITRQNDEQRKNVQQVVALYYYNKY